jgi:glucosyl-dolichyl phosphate glucuronosyltransferase
MLEINELSDLSVLICTWNNCRRLAITLEALTACQIPDGVRWELVLVSNNCTDETDRVADEFKRRLPLVYLSEPRPGVSKARNAALKVARGKLLLFTDDDVRPDTNWIAEHWRAYQAHPTGYYFGGPVESEFEGAAPDAELAALAPPSVVGLDLGNTEGVNCGAMKFIGGNWSCPREIVIQLGGCDEEMGQDPSTGRVRVGEETDQMRRLEEAGWRPWYLPQAKLAHFVPRSKCTIEHIAARAEAAGFYEAPMEIGHGGRCIYGVPGWAIKEAGRRWCRWAAARATGQKAYLDYVRWRSMIGMIRACWGQRRLKTAAMPRLGGLASSAQPSAEDCGKAHGRVSS